MTVSEIHTYENVRLSVFQSDQRDHTYTHFLQTETE